MGTGEKKTLSFKTDGDTADEISDYEKRSPTAENRSQAIDELVRIGLREQRGPLLYRWRDSAGDVALIFACGALAVLIVGMGTTVMAIGQALSVSAAFAAVGLGLVASVELGRTVNGNNELSAIFRRVRQ